MQREKIFIPEEHDPCTLFVRNEEKLEARRAPSRKIFACSPPETLFYFHRKSMGRSMSTSAFTSISFIPFPKPPKLPSSTSHLSQKVFDWKEMRVLRFYPRSEKHSQARLVGLFVGIPENISGGDEREQERKDYKLHTLKETDEKIIPQRK